MAENVQLVLSPTPKRKIRFRSDPVVYLSR